VDTLSGRGMGLSVLHEAVTRLQGLVELRPIESGGTAVTISVPLTLTRQHVLLVACGGQDYALPAFAVEKLLRIEADRMVTSEGWPAVLIDRTPVRLFALAEAVGGRAVTRGTDGRIAAALLRLGDRRLLLAVDMLRDVRHMVVKEPPAGADPLVRGTLLLESGEIGLLLDPGRIIDAADGTGPALALEAAPAVKGPPVILVVDDSITTRTLERSILEAHGFQVRLAVDGLDALEVLRSGPVDLVISDIEMPRMNGLELLETLRAEPRLAKIPVILVTSRDNPSEVERGLALGADAYLTKQQFDQRALLDTIEQLL